MCNHSRIKWKPRSLRLPRTANSPHRTRRLSTQSVIMRLWPLHPYNGQATPRTGAIPPRTQQWVCSGNRYSFRRSVNFTDNEGAEANCWHMQNFDRLTPNGAKRQPKLMSKTLRWGSDSSGSPGGAWLTSAAATFAASSWSCSSAMHLKQTPGIRLRWKPLE